MKSYRQVTILEIIAERDVETQEELAELLQQKGISVTQATVSRDIKELRLVKVLTPAGVYKYATPERADQGLADRFVRMLSDCMLSVAASENIVVVKTLSGSANLAGEALDSLNWPEILGTLAGDNTILIVARSTAEAPALVEKLRAMIR